MASRFHLMATAVLALSVSAKANFLGRRDTSACPASCLMTTTVTVVSTATVTSTPSGSNIGVPGTTTAIVEPTSTQQPPSSGTNLGLSSTTFVIIETTSIQEISSSPAQLSSMDTASSPGQASATPVKMPSTCRHNNCLRQFLRHPQVSVFCATYTNTLNTATTDLPTYVSQCHANPARISSACSCVVTGGTNPTSPNLQTSTPTGVNSSPPSNPSSVPTSDQQTASGQGTFTTQTRHHQQSQSTGTAQITSFERGMCTASMVTETYTETTTYLVTIIRSASSSSNGTSTSAVGSAAKTFISAMSSSMA